MIMLVFLLILNDFSSLILPSFAMASFLDGLSDTRVAITKKEYGFVVHSLLRFAKSLKSIFDEWLNAIC